MKTPVIDLECCVLCEVCVDVAPLAFQINDTGFVETLPLDNYENEAVYEAINNCPRSCIIWK